jgi:hypothetical protein
VFKAAQKRGGPRGEAVGVEKVSVSVDAESLASVAGVGFADEVMS